MRHNYWTPALVMISLMGLFSCEGAIGSPRDGDYVGLKESYGVWARDRVTFSGITLYPDAEVTIHTVREVLGETKVLGTTRSDSYDQAIVDPENVRWYRWSTVLSLPEFSTQADWFLYGPSWLRLRFGVTVQKTAGIPGAVPSADIALLTGYENTDEANQCVLQSAQNGFYNVAFDCSDYLVVAPELFMRCGNQNNVCCQGFNLKLVEDLCANADLGCFFDRCHNVMAANDADINYNWTGRGIHEPEKSHERFDNPELFAHADLSQVTNFLYLDPAPMDPERPESTAIALGVSRDYDSIPPPGQDNDGIIFVESSTPVFYQGMVRAAPPFTVPSWATSETYVAHYENRSYPWISIPPNCSSLRDPACASFRNRPEPNQNKPYAFPAYLGDISLPYVGMPVTLTTKRLLPPAACMELAREEVIGSSTHALSPDITLVPVHVHVFVDSDWNPSPLFSFLGNGGDVLQRAQYAGRMRRIFDNHLVRGGAGKDEGRDCGESLWGASVETRLTRNPNNATMRDSIPDVIFERCGVQLRTESVTFVAQSRGIEDGTIVVNKYERAACLIEDRFGGPNTDPSAGLREYAAYVSTAPGVHVFVTGNLEDATKDALGWGNSANDCCPGGLPSGVVILDGTSAAGELHSGVHTSHELAHVFGLDDEDSANNISEHKDTSLCDTVKTFAERSKNGCGSF